MTYEEIKEISSRLKLFDELVVEADLNTKYMREGPKFWNYQARINLRTKDGVVEAVRMVISEIPKEEEIYVCKNKLYGLSFYQKMDQDFAYDTCKNVIKDYLNDSIISERVENV